MARERLKIEGEEWKLIDGTEDIFVSNLGRVKRGKRIKKQHPNAEGYMTCYIGLNKKTVHRLVANAFIPNPDNLPVIDHIDGCKTNNVVTNLRWTTVAENTQAAYDLGLNKGSRQYDVLAVDTKNNEAYLYSSQRQAAKETGVSLNAVSKVIRGIYERIGDYKYFRCKEIHDYRE